MKIRGLLGFFGFGGDIQFIVFINQVRCSTSSSKSPTLSEIWMGDHSHVVHLNQGMRNDKSIDNKLTSQPAPANPERTIGQIQYEIWDNYKQRHINHESTLSYHQYNNLNQFSRVGITKPCAMKTKMNYQIKMKLTDISPFRKGYE